MTTEHNKILAFTALFLRRGEDILLIKHIRHGKYVLAGGKIDGDEPTTLAMLREAREEIGVELQAHNLKVVHVVHSSSTKNAGNLGPWGVETIGFFIEATEWEGEPRNMEPDKHDDIGWFNQHQLPHNTHPRLIHVLDQLKKGNFFSEYGWTKP